jgi:hypothetical protein
MSEATATLSFPTEARAAPDTRASDGLAVLLVVLIMPLAFYADNMAGYCRLLYPLSNLLLAGYLFARRSPWYVGQCILSFCFVSLVRRLVDEQAGWDPSNPVLLTPYLCCLFTGVSFFAYWSRPNPRHLGPFLVIVLCIVYGTALAVLQGRILAAFIDALKWSVGPLFAVHVMAQGAESSARRIAERCLVWSGAVMGAYGIAQYIAPSSWDTQWMRSVAELGLDSIGQPEPYAVRVFSTMNSPGSLGAFLLAGIVLALKRPIPAMAVSMPLMIVGLALCQYRTLWAATAFAVAMVLLSGRQAVRPENVLALIAVAVVLASTAVVPRIRETIVERASSLTQLRTDESLGARLDQYAALSRMDDLIAGEGLAISGASRRLDGRAPVAIDGALIEIWRAMGAIVGTLFILSMGMLAASLLGASQSPGSAIAFDRAILVATFLQLPMGSVHIGELGFCAWMFLGFGLAQTMTPQTRSARG